ncbi:MAG: SDR family oxidoreductase [Candidatus Binatia bacterium]|nr:SDR family oxidoreductase [Candidatus Binatia bacterium]
MDLGLAGKGIIVTGGGSNIGRSISLCFAKEGANVLIGDIDIPQAEKTAAEANALKAGGRTSVVKCDVTSLDDVKGMLDTAVSQFGRVEALVNNVGWDNLMLFLETTPDFWDKVISINYKGVLNCTHTILPHMIEKGGGSIVSISSDASRMGEFREAVYGGCKAAINSFMKTIARENGRHAIRANVVCPGVTVPKEPEQIGEQSMWRSTSGLFTEEQMEKIARAMPLRKVGRPDDIAYPVVFLSSSVAAGHITGQILSASGGYSMVG